jgi:crotonobetainyl-CoA:carnitine CoA-transferase CaiB-like acyl-CoA transferase
MTSLDDIKVLDVTQVVSGSFASMMLADLGAEVLKIERPNGGDIGRSNPPFLDGHSTYFTSVNRNKKSVALDLKSDQGRKAFLSLAETADVIVENNPTGRMARFGLDYESIRERNKDIVYCSITGFGQTGPYQELPALDIIAQAISGNMSITGHSSGDPHRAGIPIADIAASMYTVQSVILALYERERGDEGQFIDVSMVDSMISWLTVRAGYTFGTGERYPRIGNQLQEFVPYNTFETADSHIVVVVVTDRHWRQLCEAIDRPELAEDERFTTMEARREHREEVNRVLSETFRERTAEEWFERISEQHVPVAPIYDTKEVWEDKHVQSRNLLTDIEDEGFSFKAIRHPVDFSETNASIRRGVPDLGEHTYEELRRIGYDEEEIDEFIALIENRNDNPDRN